MLDEKNLKNYYFYLILTYFIWLSSLLIYFFNEYIKAGGLENGLSLARIVLGT